MSEFDHIDKSTFLNGKDKSRLLRAIISPSLMVADQTMLLQDALHVLSAEGGAVEWLHVDVIDGHFASNLSFCPDTVRDLRRHLPHTFLDCHLMVTEPAQWMAPFAKAGASGFTFHYEVVKNVSEVCAQVRAAKMQVGIAIKPITPVDVLFPLIETGCVDMVLIMTVVPGFAGQAFMPSPLSKIRALRRKYPYLNIQVDGAINLETIDAVAKAGANIAVPGQAVFKAVDRRKNVEMLRKAINKNIYSSQKFARL